MMRDYKKEYRDYHGTPDQIAKRSKRNQARRLMADHGLVHKGDGKEVDHKQPISKGGGNNRGNLQVLSRHKNRTKGSS